MNVERPPSPEPSSPPSKPRTRTVLDRVFRYLPAGSRRVVGAMALGAMEVLSNNVEDPSFQNADTMNDAHEIVQEDQKSRLERALKADELKTAERIDEIRKRIKNG